ncbi:hypothetical protein NQ315_016781 [Exocentrus adspersus]|uniref:RNase H type-1 domain-containing protein n=1 Tax=Exocentrus adspersus TaxID=1586481 RepID=A0AAV8VDS7_9CUCU|nr:hypothetical protein NQ315_016781 [Exocentrus adspersus]
MFVVARREYLGVTIDRKLNWIEHVAKIRERTKEVSLRMFMMGRRKWGDRKFVLKALYEGMVCPMVLYTAEILGEKARDTRIRRHLRATERPFLRAISRAYRTAPTAAMAVLAGVAPWKCRRKPAEWPHPALAGWMPATTGEAQQLVIYVDASMSEEGKGLASVMRTKNGWREEGCRVEGSMGSADLETIGVHKAVIWGGEEAIRTGVIWVVVKTDAKEIVTGLTVRKQKRISLRLIRKEIMPMWEKGVTVQVQWGRRGRRKEREGRTGRQGDGQGTKEWRGERRDIWRRDDRRKDRVRFEKERWQALWDEGTTGRWMFQMWPRVNGEGAPDSGALTQVLTGHGGFRGYLGRFRLIDTDGMCECGEGVESVQHIAMECPLEGSRRVRGEAMRQVGHSIPRVDQLEPGGWDRVIAWAERIVAEGGWYIA